MGTKESSAPSTQVVAFEMQKKEELILDEYTESLTIYEGGSVGTDFVGKRVAEGKKTTCISGNNCDGASQRGEDSSDKSGGTSREDYEQRMERRRLANREAARRSRIRRQELVPRLKDVLANIPSSVTLLFSCVDCNQECEKLQATAEILESEIAQIPRDIWRLSEQIEKLREENDSIFDELEKKYGADAVSDLRAVKDSLEGKGKDTDPKTPSRDS
ncbi:bZIP transcription factor 16-like isoform X2 [Malus sylvestris]|uniref:bZIP transcription factor 11 isoform X1 n=1 Tax=Malus domestica TaxID=3750 RepID=UPI000498D56D|nr:bZIP transcription factor 16 isoform X1 [Malus domestica]XP_050108300.1 bZIP transcription factor 16-like isoform X2 [Malus sylvestris]